jgi:hypothetical protein
MSVELRDRLDGAVVELEGIRQFLAAVEQPLAIEDVTQLVASGFEALGRIAAELGRWPQQRRADLYAVDGAFADEPDELIDALAADLGEVAKEADVLAARMLHVARRFEPLQLRGAERFDPRDPPDDLREWYVVRESHFDVGRSIDLDGYPALEQAQWQMRKRASEEQGSIELSVHYATPDGIEDEPVDRLSGQAEPDP